MEHSLHFVMYNVLRACLLLRDGAFPSVVACWGYDSLAGAGRWLGEGLFLDPPGRENREPRDRLIGLNWRSLGSCLQSSSEFRGSDT